MRLRPDPGGQNPGRSQRLAPPGPGTVQPAQAAAKSAQAVPATPSLPARGQDSAWFRPLWAPNPLAFALLAIVTFLCYAPCLNGQFVWDDDAWTIHLQRLFTDFSGLAAIWTRLTALQQYYPLTATTFWIDYQLWGFWTLPYHLENVLLHLVAVWMFWRLLNHLEVSGAWLAGAVLALHPMMVESVGWITERKNVLSLVLFLGALMCYARFTSSWRTEADSLPVGRRDNSKPWQWYLCALVLFLAAYLAKATAFALPAVLLLIAWWKRGRLRFRADILLTLPFFGIAGGLGVLTSWLERTHVGASGPDWNLSLIQRCCIAGHALWFYVGKLLWPVNLCFVYPRWHVEVHSAAQCLWPVLAVVVVAALWAFRRRIGRGPLCAVLFFAGTLFPLLGFMNGYFMRYSFVCDHWAYLPSLGLIALGAALVDRLSDRFQAQRVFYVSAVLVLLAFGILTWQHSVIFADSETLYRATLAHNPDADLAHNNLGLLLFRAGDADEAIVHFERALEIRPGSAHAHNNLANVYRLMGRAREAAAHYETSLRLEPNNANTYNNLALLLATCSDVSVRNGPRAIELAQRAQQLTPGKNPVVLATLAAAYAESGHFADAVKSTEEALQLVSNNPNSSLAQALQAQLNLYLKGIPYHESAPAATVVP